MAGRDQSSGIKMPITTSVCLREILQFKNLAFTFEKKFLKLLSYSHSASILVSEAICTSMMYEVSLLVLVLEEWIPVVSLFTKIKKKCYFYDSLVVWNLQWFEKF